MAAAIFVGLVLGAGDSARMGTAKTLLQVAGRPAWLRLSHACLSSGCAEVRVLVSTPEGETLDAGLPASDRASIRILEVPEDLRQLGPIGSLMHGVRNTEALAGRLVWPVDHPFVSARTLELLLREPDKACVPTYQGSGGHPIYLPARLDEDVIRTGESGGTLRDLLASRPSDVTRVAVEDPAVHWNCNTTEDFERYRRLDEESRS